MWEEDGKSLDEEMAGQDGRLDFLASIVSIKIKSCISFMASIVSIKAESWISWPA